jgi:adenine phosphoribosyltransferase
MNDDARVASLKKAIRDVPDFPKKGIVFKDITTLLKDARAFREAMDLFADLCQRARPDKIVAIESRGFILGAALADRMGIGFVPVRKKGKLPWRRVECSYDLEYGVDTIEMHEDGLAKGQRALVVDDVIATGGTAAAAGVLVRRLGAELAGYLFLIELSFLNGRARLGSDTVSSVIVY